ncbi:MAG TPA: hypothetical protein VE913_08970 [Longimicrobium sp.]|nr:hypothetical protein [Longimicrobium sp.]
MSSNSPAIVGCPWRSAAAIPVRYAARFLVPPQQAERVAQAAVGVPLVVGKGEVGAKLAGGALPVRGALALQRQPEARTRIFGIGFGHLDQRVGA